jgi:diguanylate cyclase (GGDEF)-like protein
VATQADITLRKRYEEQIVHHALHDTLTGLPNRLMFNERITYALAHAHRHGDYDFAVLMLDLDQFKFVNDGLGHTAGDQLLIEVATRIAGILEPADTLARLGGDDFGLIVEDVHTPYDAARIARRVQRALQGLAMISGHSITVSSGIGIVLNSARYTDAEAIVRDADTAMYRAKNRGRSQYEIFDAELHRIALNRLTLENELRRAITNREFRVYFQPIIEIATNRFAAGEALIRWQHPELGLVGPGYFLDVAIEAELMEEIGDIVLQDAVTAAAEWRGIADQYGYRHPSVTVNLDERELRSPSLVDRISGLLNRHEMEPTQLVVEMTERALSKSSQVPIETIEKLSKLGVRIATDDFGVGYSTFAILQQLPVDFLKLDRSIISSTANRRYSDAILRSISSLTAELGIRTVAEGIESPAQLAIAARVGISLAQGFHLGFPAPLSEVSAFFQARAGEQSLC